MNSIRSIQLPDGTQLHVRDWFDVSVEVPLGQVFTTEVFGSGCYEVVLRRWSARDGVNRHPMQALQGGVRLWVGEKLEREAPLADLMISSFADRCIQLVGVLDEMLQQLRDPEKQLRAESLLDRVGGWAYPVLVPQAQTMRVELVDVPDWCTPIVTLVGVGARDA